MGVSRYTSDHYRVTITVGCAGPMCRTNQQAELECKTTEPFYQSTVILYIAVGRFTRKLLLLYAGMCACYELGGVIGLCYNLVVVKAVLTYAFICIPI